MRPKGLQTLLVSISPFHIETAESLDVRLENFSAVLLEEVYSCNKRLVFRGMHRNEHLDEVEVALKD
jgi:hypothetical protein